MSIEHKIKHKIIRFLKEQDPTNEDYKKIRRASLLCSTVALFCLAMSAVMLVYFDNIKLSLAFLICYAVFNNQTQMWDLAGVWKKLKELSGDKQKVIGIKVERERR